MCFGIPDTYRGETVKAVLVINGTVSENEIKNWCAERLAKYKVPRIIEFREEIPKTSVGKNSTTQINRRGKRKK